MDSSLDEMLKTVAEAVMRGSGADIDAVEKKERGKNAVKVRRVPFADDIHAEIHRNLTHTGQSRTEGCWSFK